MIHNSSGIGREPPANPRRIIPRFVITQPRFLIPLHPRVSIPLQTHLRGAAPRLIGRTAVGVIFLVGDDPPGIIEFQRDRAEVIALLVAEEWQRRSIASPGSGLDHRDALFIVHHMQGLPLQGHHGAIAVVLAVDLKSAEVDPFILSRAVRSFGELADAPAGGVVYIIGRLRRARVDRLPGGGLQLIHEIPLHQRKMGNGGHVAVGVVAVRFGILPADGCTAQAVAGLSRFDQAGLVVGVAAGPVTAGGLVDQSPEIARRIVLVSLGVAAHGLAVARVGQAHAEFVAPGRFGPRCLADMLAPFRMDQTVDRVVGVVIVGRYRLVAEVDRLLRIVVYPGDVADGVVGIVQVLQPRPVCEPNGLDVDQPEGQGVIRVLGPDAVAVLDRHASALGVVIDVGHERGGLRPAAEIHVDFFKEVGFIEARVIDALVGRCRRYRPVEGVVGRAAGERLRLQIRTGRPVERRRVFLRQLPPAGQQVAFEVISFVRHDARRIENLDRRAAQVEGFGVGTCFAVDRSADEAFRRRAFQKEGFGGPPQGIKSRSEPVIAAVPGVERIARRVGKHSALARFHGGLINAGARHVVVVAHDDAVVGVDHLARVAFDVENDAGAVKFLRGRIGRRRIGVFEPVVGHGEKGAPQRVGMDDRGRSGMNRGFFRGLPFGGAPFRIGPLLLRFGRMGRIGSQRVPCRQVFGLRQTGEELRDIGICRRIERCGVVDVVRRLPPGIEDDFLPGVVGVQDGDHALRRIVEQYRADADGCAEPEIVGVVEKRLVPADGVALVVEDRPAAADPSGICRRPSAGEGTRFRLDLFLDLPAEAVGVGDGDLDPGPLIRLQVTDMGLSRDDGGERRRTHPTETVEVVQNAGGGLAQQVVYDRCRRAFVTVGPRLARPGHESVELGLGRVRRKGCIQEIAQRFGHLSHDGRSGDHAQRVEGRFGAVAVRIGHQAGRQNPVVVPGADRVAESVAAAGHEQHVIVEAHLRLGAHRIRMEGIAEAVRQEEMRAGVFEFPGGGIAAVG